MSSRSTRSVSAELATANAALDVCAALIRAQGSEAPLAEEKPSPSAPDPMIEKERVRLVELRSAVTDVTSRYAGAGQSGGAAVAIAECTSKIITERLVALDASHRPTPMQSVPVNAPVRSQKIQRALRAALDRYFSYFEVPGTNWRLDWRLFCESGMPTATAYGSSPGNIEGAYPIPLPEEAPWRSPTKLTELESAAKTISIVGVGPKPLSPSKYFLAGLSWSGGEGAIVLSRSKRKASGQVMLAYPGDGTVTATPIDDVGNPTGPAAAQSAETSAYLDAVWWKLSASAMGLIHGRGDATSLTHNGIDVEQHPEPIRMAEAIMASNEEIIEKVEREVDEAMHAKLASKFDDLPQIHRERLGGIAFASGSNPPSFAASETSENEVGDDDVISETPEASDSKESKAPAELAASSQHQHVRPDSESTTQMPAQTARLAGAMFAELSDSEPSESRVSKHTITRPSIASGSGPITMKAEPPKATAEADEAPLFGSRTLDEKFEGLDLEIDWDEPDVSAGSSSNTSGDIDDDAPTHMLGEDYSSETLPGVIPSGPPRAATVTIQRER